MHYGNCNAEPTIIRSVLRENQICSVDEVEVFPKLKQNPCKVSVKDFSKELFSKLEGYTPAFLPNSSTNFSATFCEWSFKKYVSYVIFY